MSSEINNTMNSNPNGSGTEIVPDSLAEVKAKLKELGADEADIGMIIDLGVNKLEDLNEIETDDLVSAGMKVIKARKLVKNLKKQSTAVNEPVRIMPQLDSLLPAAPTDDAWLTALKTGGVLKVDDSSYIAAIRAALADRAGLYNVPHVLVEAMEKYADETEEQVDPIFFSLRKSLTRRTYGDIFEAIDGLDGSYITDKRRQEFLDRVRTTLWPAIIESYEQLEAWYNSWRTSMADPSMLYGMLSGGLSNLGINAITPPDTSILHDAGDTLVNCINSVFKRTGVQLAAALAYEAKTITKTLEDNRLPAMIGAKNRELMLKKIGAGVSSNYVRLERNLVQYVLAYTHHDAVGSDEEIKYFVALYQLGTQINWKELGGGDTGIKGLTGKKIL